MNHSVGCSSGMPWWKDLRQRMRNCLPTGNGNNGGNNPNEVLVEVKQVKFKSFTIILNI